MVKIAGQQCHNRWFSKHRIQMATGFGLALILSGIGSTLADTSRSGRAVTGKIVIDGVIYGGGEQQMRTGSGDFSRDKRQLEAFRSVKILGGVDVNYRRAPEQRVEITGDRNLLPLIKTQVSQGVLTVGSRDSYQTQLPLTLELSGPILTSIAMLGAGDIVLKGLDEDSLKLELSGSGDVKAEGKVGHLSVDLTGGSDVDAEKLVSEQAEVRLTGSGDVNLTVRHTLKVQILGSGDITYYGNPVKIEKRIIGSGEIQSGD